MKYHPHQKQDRILWLCKIVQSESGPTRCLINFWKGLGFGAEGSNTCNLCCLEQLGVDLSHKTPFPFKGTFTRFWNFRVVMWRDLSRAFCLSSCVNMKKGQIQWNWREKHRALCAERTTHNTLRFVQLATSCRLIAILKVCVCLYSCCLFH